MRVAFIIAACLLCGAASAQSVGGMSGISNVTGSGGGGAPLVTCLAGQLDFSDVTGCNTALFLTVMH